MKALKFKEYDIVGEDTLSVISEAHNFNAWMYETIKPFCKGRVLEIGSGIGNISAYFLNDKFPIFLTDIRSSYCANLDKKFISVPCFLGIEVMDLTDPKFDEKFAHHHGAYDTVFALNVVEHILEDQIAVKNCYKLLNDGGHLIILVPSYKKLYNNFDKELGHFRRYTKSSLSNLFLVNNFKVTHKQYFNFIGIFGWFVTGTILKKETIPAGQMKLYNSLVPLFKIFDKLIFNSAGLSTIVVGKKILQN